MKRFVITIPPDEVETQIAAMLADGSDEELDAAVMLRAAANRGDDGISMDDAAKTGAVYRGLLKAESIRVSGKDGEEFDAHGPSAAKLFLRGLMDIEIQYGRDVSFRLTVDGWIEALRHV